MEGPLEEPALSLLSVFQKIEIENKNLKYCYEKITVDRVKFFFLTLSQLINDWIKTIFFTWYKLINDWVKKIFFHDTNLLMTGSKQFFFMVTTY